MVWQGGLFIVAMIGIPILVAWFVGGDRSKARRRRRSLPDRERPADPGTPKMSSGPED